jgi:hypothetical protein
MLHMENSLKINKIPLVINFESRVPRYVYNFLEKLETSLDTDTNYKFRVLSLSFKAGFMFGLGIEQSAYIVRYLGSCPGGYLHVHRYRMSF